MKVVQATHHQGDIRYGMLRGIQCSCMSLMSVCWTLFKSVSIWDSFDLDCILQKGFFLFKSLNKYRYLSMKDLPQEFFIENSSINVQFLNIRTGEITAGAYLVSITEIVSDCQQIGTGALLIINKYILGLLWGNQCFFLFDSHSNDEIGRMSATGTAVLLKFDFLQSLENYTKSVYYSNYSMTLYFQVQFLKLKCTENAKSIIKNALKSERKKKVSSMKYHQGPEKNARS